MARLTACIVVFALGAASAVALVSCGGSDDSGLLPGDTASNIVENLDRVKELAASGQCADAQAAADEVQLQVSDLDAEVDRRLKRALLRGARRLQVVAGDCVEQLTEPTSEETTTASPTDETTTRDTTKETTGSTTTETEPTTGTTTQTQTTTPTTPTPPPPPAGGGSGGVGPGVKAQRGA